MMRLLVVLLGGISSFCVAKDVFEDAQNRYLVACHSTDFECFKIQYQNLRDKALMGNAKLNIPKYKQFMFRYSPSTCIKLSGLEHSTVTAVQLNSNSMEFTWTLQMPFMIQQVNVNNTRICANPDSEFKNVSPKRGPLKKFRGNATISVSYPYTLKKKNGQVHMILSDENLDVVLDIPDLSHYNHESQFESNLYELSEWAYDAVQHIDAAQHFALPYTTQFRTLTQQVPLSRLMLLYPDESYVDLHFNLSYKTCTCPSEK